MGNLPVLSLLQCIAGKPGSAPLPCHGLLLCLRSDTLPPALMPSSPRSSSADVANHLAWTDTYEPCSPLIYSELKALAARAMRGESGCHTLQTTALVNEAWVRVTAQRGMDPANRSQYLCIAAQMMRRVLVDHSRRRTASKRPSSKERIDIDEIDLPDTAADFIDLDSALERLARISPRQAQVVDLKFFAGLELEEIAELLGIARPTVVRDWRMARAWLQRELADE